MHKNVFLNFFVFLEVCDKKPDIVIPDLYFYDIKILPDIKNNINKKWEHHKYFFNGP